ncbi:MAG: hypothetical protein V3V84_06665 [Candidatus Bathyarchaeia archaeon]
MDMSSDFGSDPAIRRWLAAYDHKSHVPRLNMLLDYLTFLDGKKCFEKVTPSGLVEFQRHAKKEDREYEMIDLLKEYIRGKPGTYKALRLRVSIVKSFFRENRADLPDEKIRIRASRSPVQSKMDDTVVRDLVENNEFDMKAFYLTLFMGLLDLDRFLEFNRKYGKGLVDHLKEKGVDEPFVIEYPGRKENRNKTWFTTFIGHDALVAWKNYFERRRGYPKEGEAILLDERGKPIQDPTLRQRHIRMLARLNYIKRGNDISTRHGYGLHNFRDAARTLLHKAKHEGLDLDCAEFWMGHTIDPNDYDQFYRDKEYLQEQYKIAEKHLNIISGFTTSSGQDTKELAQQIIKNPEAFKVLQDAMVEIVGAKLSPIEQKEK